MTKTLAFLLTATLAGCAREPEVQYSRAEPTPAMVAMDSDPRVMVVTNSDEPIFYSDHAYWLYRDHQWYRSTSHRGSWARVDRPPERLQRIDRPTDYVRYPGATRTARSPSDDRERREPPSEEEPRSPSPREEVLQPERDRPAPEHEPNPQGPDQPYGNPLPPQQVPPVDPEDLDRPDHQIAPDPDPTPTSPGTEPRPARDPDDRARDQDERTQDDREPDEAD